MNFESYFYEYLETAFSGVSLQPQKLLKEAMYYSLKSKASRFRPRLCFATAKNLGKRPEQILAWAIALEMIHTGSLIHDDMPCMDNERIRRGKACNHLKFGEDISLLAGTCLFVESFSLLKDSVFDKKRKSLLELLTASIGFKGLMSGQAMDLKIKKASKAENLKIMKLKTASLISACVEGPVILWSQQTKQREGLLQFAENLGLAYQLADDFKDKKEKKREYFKEGVERIDKSLQLLKSLSGDTKALEDLTLSLRQRFSQ